MTETAHHHERRKRPYRYRLVNIECMPQSDHFNVIMDLEESIEDLLPYCAAVLPGATYVHGSGVVNVMDQGHIVGIYAKTITITDVSGPEEAVKWCDLYYEKIEHIRRNRENIAPALRTRPAKTVLDIYRTLPKTNCGRCGVPTCLAFAAMVFRGESSLDACVEVSR
ncbi:(Fe-S)-binding protein [Desulfosoma caldarium]|uniref:ArsR family metal-binding transcriptional regulator n=1 Tax=Desulfosoma caldarium TaxID=610254 RepID=A0A3N1VJN1_9BACT|nr:(Fe-S)-binding protein [Desulfosoma caldarium]ROR03016.1 ArsR family metal-binding transcriptional regulator [Desulfosoma caldarium]